MSKLTSAQFKAYVNGGAKAHVEPVFHIHVITNDLNGTKYVTVRQNLSAEAFFKIVSADTRDHAAQIPLLWSFRQFGRDSHSIRTIATYTDRDEARAVAAKMIERLALKGLSLNAGRARVGATETFAWGTKAEGKAAQAAAIAKAKAARAAAKNDKVAA